MDEDICIVCMGDLKPELDGEASLRAPAPVSTHVEDSSPAPATPALPAAVSALPIAQLKPCGHILHDECIRSWAERANSCPLCRQKFNLVETSAYLGGPKISEYEVKDKIQAAEYDMDMIYASVEEYIEFDDPCRVCGRDNDPETMLLCDGCDASYHTFCVYLEHVPNGEWYCEACTEQAASGRSVVQQTPEDLQLPRATPRTAAARRNAWYDHTTRRRAMLARFTRHAMDGVYDALVAETPSWRRTNLPTIAERRRNARRGDENFTSASVLEEEPVPVVETPEEASAWDAFETAKRMELDTAAKTSKRSRSITASPLEPAPAPERKLKRPRTRRATEFAEPSAVSENQEDRVRKRPRIEDSTRPSFLGSLLREVQATSSADSSKGKQTAVPTPPIINTGLPAGSSSGQASPATSNHSSPRAFSTSPILGPSSPNAQTTLSSAIRPRYLPPNYSPDPPTLSLNSAVSVDHTSNTTTERNADSEAASDVLTSNAASPTPAPPMTTKSIVVQMVRRELRPFLRAKEINEQDFETINRRVCRQLYTEVENPQELQGDSKSLWQNIAKQRVVMAIDEIKQNPVGAVGA